jgi:hypothetical protein
MSNTDKIENQLQRCKRFKILKIKKNISGTEKLYNVWKYELLKILENINLRQISKTSKFQNILKMYNASHILKFSAT